MFCCFEENCPRIFAAIEIKMTKHCVVCDENIPEKMGHSTVFWSCNLIVTKCNNVRNDKINSEKDL